MTENQTNKRVVQAFMAQLDAGKYEALEALVTDDFVCYGFHPYTTLSGLESYLQEMVKPFTSALPERERVMHLFVAGVSQGKAEAATDDGVYWVGASGYFVGSFAGEWLGFPPTGQELRLRWAEFYKMREGKIASLYCQIDLIDFCQQLSCDPLPFSPSARFVYPAPALQSGVFYEAQDESESARTLSKIRTFIYEGLNSFDEEDLSTMAMRDYFAPHLRWYGPGGIGGCFSVDEFEAFHQAPWLLAFPDRKVQTLDSLFAEGNIAASSGWAGVVATHSGVYKGVAATGNKIIFNGIDFWLYDNDIITENWVFVDLPHIFSQMNVDILSQARYLGQRRGG